MNRSAALFCLFCAGCGVRTQPQNDAQSVTYWNGWYEKNHKIGYLQTVIQSYPERVRFERRGRLTTEMMGTVTAATPRTIVNTDRNYALRDFDFVMSTPGHDYHVTGAVRGSRIQMTVESGGQRQSSALELSGPVYPLEALPQLIRSRSLEPGIKYEITIFDPMIQKMADAEITVLGREQLRVAESTYQTLKVSALLFGVPHTVWIDSAGIVVREEAPPSSLTILEPSAVAMATRPEEAPPDLMSIFAVPSSQKLDNPTQLKYLKLELSGIEPEGFDLEDESQKILNLTPLTLAISPARPGSAGASFPFASETAGLKPSLSIQSNSPAIQRKARELAAGSNDALKTAQAIYNWVFVNVRSRGTPSMPSATDVLATLEGDCNEHAVLYAALCRALLIPCRVCVGLVYRDGRFWYHAWNKVFVGHPTGWVPVDATFGQFPVDATHIKLKEGEMDEQARVLTVVGRLAVRILESRS